MPDPPVLHLFDAFGIELEYMVVDAQSLDVRPITDELLRSVAGTYVTDIEEGPIAWSNELALHVVELKTNGPAASLDGLADLFSANVRRVNELLTPFGCRLLPGAMHPWMDPHRELKLWPHEYSPVYEAYNSVFDCRGHGWANLQSMHINLPFADDAEFGRLHAAIRIVLPILPGLAASSPVIDGRVTGVLNNRMDVYRSNSRRVPSVAGRVIPERAFSQSEYNEQILNPMYKDIAPLDPAGVLRDEFLNSRGAIARFSRRTIEIRVLDVQECPKADLAIAALTVGLLRLLVSEHWTDCLAQQAIEVEPLESILLSTIRDADRARIDDSSYLALFGIEAPTIAAGELWQQIHREIETSIGPLPSQLIGPAQTLLKSRPLSRRILAALGNEPSRARLHRVYQQLSECVAHDQMFVGSD